MDHSLIKLYPVTISGMHKISHNAFILSFPRSFSFQAGQVIGIGLRENDDARIYSIASGTNDEHIDILFNIKPSGSLTPKLALLRPGDTIFISEPFGSFLGTTGPAWWIATGTGIAPYRSMMRSGFTPGKWVIHGSGDPLSFYFEQEFTDTFGHHYMRCLSKPQDPHLASISGSVYAGRITGFINTFDILDKNQLYYLCGSAGMVIDIRELLLIKGIPYGNILAEVYF